MAAPNTNITPGLAGGDLPEAEKKAFLEGHDADIPTDTTTPSRAVHADHDIEKSNLHSKSTSLSDDHDNHDDTTET
ncbi:hypothetical protein Slin14017_G109770 [Septoria linicola]|nr:hypothetical protein Slin14017_G109770 [Septoria linicola]